MNNIWVTSDWHFAHDKFFCYERRGFKSVFEMNEELLYLHNHFVAPNDEVYVLGDLTLGDTEVGIKYIREMNGRLHIIRGNHDSDKKIKEYAEMPNVVEIVDAKFLNYGKFHFFLSHYPALTANYDEKSLKQKMINLCGHIHTLDRFADFDKGLIYHCEVDAHDNKPVLLDDIIQEIKTKVRENNEKQP